MKSIVKICDLNTFNDVNRIQDCISQLQGILACEISIEKKEIQIVYNEAFINIDKIINTLENIGFLVL